jgi:hypothetical protein
MEESYTTLWAPVHEDGEIIAVSRHWSLEELSR